MKYIKKIIHTILVAILINLIGILAISCNLKVILVDGVIKETIKEQILKNEYKEENLIISEEEINKITDDERVREILNSKEVQDLMNKYLDITMNSLIEEENIEEITLETDILEYLKNNRETLSELLGQEVTVEAIEKTEEQLESKEMTRVFKQTIENANRNMTTRERTVLKGYKVLTSTGFKLIILFAIFIDIILIAVIQKSIYRWIKTLSKSMIVSGILVFIMSLVVKWIVQLNASIKQFQTTSLSVTGIIIATIGILLRIVYKLFTKEIEKKEEKYEIS